MELTFETWVTDLTGSGVEGAALCSCCESYTEDEHNNTFQKDHSEWVSGNEIDAAVMVMTGLNTRGGE